MSAQTESKEASFQMLIPKHTLAWYLDLDTRSLGRCGLSLPVAADTPGTWVPACSQSWLSTARGRHANAQAFNGNDGKMS